MAANPIADFFTKYHAVPIAVGPGVERIAYESATDNALIGHVEGDCRAWDEKGLPAHVRLDVQNRLTEARDELWKRMGRFGVGGVDYTADAEPDGLRPLRRAWHAACVRVGFGPSNT